MQEFADVSPYGVASMYVAMELYPRFSMHFLLPREDIHVDI